MRKITIAVLLTLLACAFACAACGEDLPQVEYEVEYEYDMARSMMSAINEHRTAEDAWYWNRDNTQKVVLPVLEPLTYDENLEKVAMQRAAEVAIYFEHARPNGDSCFSIYPDSFFAAENIAAGQFSTEQAFDSWWEEDEPYAGQGHRRNLLDQDLTRIGIGCVKAGGRYYWAQAFTSENAGEAVESNPTVFVTTVAPSVLQETGNWDVPEKTLYVNVGETVSLPQELTAKGGILGSLRFTLTNPTWTASGDAISLSGCIATGIKAGQARVVLQENSSVSITVIVQEKEGGAAPTAQPSPEPTAAPKPTEKPGKDPVYRLTAIHYDGKAVIGHLEHEKGTLPANELGARVTFFITGNYYMATVGEVDEAGDFSIEGVGPIEYISVVVYDHRRDGSTINFATAEITLY